MFGRVAAWGFAAFLILWPAACAVETGTFASANTPAAAAITAPPEQAQAEHQDQAHDRGQAQPKVAALEPPAPQISAPAVPAPFGLTVLPVAGGDVLTKWNGVEADIRAEREILARCRESTERCPGVARDFLTIVAQGRAQTGRSRIGAINRAINLAIQPTSDMAQWGVPDRWSAPLDTFTTRRGDCEDYAIAKYVALTEAGIAAEDVKLVIVRNTAANEDHAVAAVRLDGEWIMLDNRWLTLVEDVDMPQAIPLFVLDQDGVGKFVPAAMTLARRTASPATLGF
jgi:predicted transglutaminase-like cysteine proteinase